MTVLQTPEQSAEPARQHTGRHGTPDGDDILFCHRCPLLAAGHKLLRIQVAQLLQHLVSIKAVKMTFSRWRNRNRTFRIVFFRSALCVPAPSLPRFSAEAVLEHHGHFVARTNGITG